MLHQVIETLNARVALRPRYDNFIGGKWVAPVDGDYFDNISPITGKPVCQIARSQAADIELALDAAHKAKDAWGNTAPAKRAEILNKIADRMEENLKVLAAVETIDNGKPIRETTFADIPLAIDHFRYFAACVRAQEGSLSEIDHDTIAYHYHEPLGVVGQIIPWNFPILMAVLEARAGARRRQLRGAEAGRADADVDHGADGPDRRPAAARRAQRGQRLRRRGRQAARPEQAHRQDRLHRRDHHRPADHAICVREPDPGHARARRQVAQHLLRRRDGRGRRLLRQGARGLRHVRAEPGRGLHLPVARAGAAVDLRQVHGEGGRPGEQDQAGQSARAVDHDRRAGLQRSAGEDPVLCRYRQEGRRQAA